MPDAIYLAGPTASGKSAVAVELALRLGGEIISVDSMQVYRGLDLGTAKPSAEERRLVPHHLIDVAELSQPFDAAQFLRLAKTAEISIRQRQRLPIYCGGTGLYFNALIGGLSPLHSPDPTTRSELENTPLPALLEKLQSLDPETYQKTDRANPRRVIRALEIINAPQHRPNWNNATQTGAWFALERERADLYTRIDQRVDLMFRRGLVDETKALLARGLDQNRTALQAIGYRQVADHLAGFRDLPATIALIKQKTRHYAKRQLTWFRHQLQLHWIPAPPDSTPASLADKILAAQNSA